MQEANARLTVVFLRGRWDSQRALGGEHGECRTALVKLFAESKFVLRQSLLACWVTYRQGSRAGRSDISEILQIVRLIGIA